MNGGSEQGGREPKRRRSSEPAGVVLLDDDTEMGPSVWSCTACTFDNEVVFRPSAVTLAHLESIYALKQLSSLSDSADAWVDHAAPLASAWAHLLLITCTCTTYSHTDSRALLLCVELLNWISHWVTW